MATARRPSSWAPCIRWASARLRLRLVVRDHRQRASGASGLQRLRSDDDDTAGTEDMHKVAAESRRRVELLRLFGRHVHASTRTLIIEFQPLVAGGLARLEYISDRHRELAGIADGGGADLHAIAHDGGFLVRSADDDGDDAAFATDRMPLIG